MYDSIEYHIHELKYEVLHSNIVTNVLPSDLWQKKYANRDLDGLMLPLFVYYDDFESGNALGSHAGVNKFGAVYVSIA